MELPTIDNIILNDSEGKISTAGETGLILGIPDSNNCSTLKIPFGFNISPFDEEKGSVACIMDKKFIEEYEKFEQSLLRKAKNLDAMSDVTSVKSSIRTLKGGEKFLTVKCGKNTEYRAFKDGKVSNIDKYGVVKQSAGTIACRVFLWKFMVGNKQTMGVSLMADEITLTSTEPKSKKKRVIKTLSYLKQQKKGKIMAHKDIEELNL